MHSEIRLMKEIFGALLQLRDELPIIETQQVIYYPDFNLIYPYVHRQTEARYRFTDALGTCLFNLNNALSKPPNIHICISFPTAIEFLIFLQRHHDEYKRQLNNSYISSYVYKCMVELEAGRIAMGEIESEKIKAALLLAQVVSGSSEGLSRFIKAIFEQKVDMLADHYSVGQVNQLLADRRTVLDGYREADASWSREGR
jgi:hypothetical protein